MKIAKRISVLEIKSNMMGNDSSMYPTLIYDEKNIALIDAGMPGSFTKIKKAIENEGLDIKKLNKIIITHQDIDHIGGIRSIISNIPKIKIFAHEEDKPYIEGEKFFIRVQTISGLGKRAILYILSKYFIVFKKIPVNVDEVLEDGEELDIAGGVIVIHTPGHTPGHICLYHKESKTMIVGDELNIIEGELTGANKGLMSEEEMNLAYTSLKKLKNFDIETIVSFHGGIFNNKPNEAIEKLLENY